MYSMLKHPHYRERAVIHIETMKMIGTVGVVSYSYTFNKIEASRPTPNIIRSSEAGLF